MVTVIRNIIKNLLLFLWFCAKRKTTRTTNFLSLFERLIYISNCWSSHNKLDCGQPPWVWPFPADELWLRKLFVTLYFIRSLAVIRNLKRILCCSHVFARSANTWEQQNLFLYSSGWSLYRIAVSNRWFEILEGLLVIILFLRFAQE